MNNELKINKKIRSCRLSDVTVKNIYLISRNELLTESETTRMLIHKGVKEYNLEKAIDAYNNKKLDLTGASRIAGISKRDFMEELENKGVGINLDEKCFDIGMKTMDKLFGKPKKKTTRKTK